MRTSLSDPEISLDIRSLATLSGITIPFLSLTVRFTGCGGRKSTGIYVLKRVKGSKTDETLLLTYSDRLILDSIPLTFRSRSFS